MQLLGNLGSHIKVWSSGGAGLHTRLGWVHPHQRAAQPPSILEDVAKEIGSRRFYERLARWLCCAAGAAFASLRAGSVTLTDEIPNILQGLQQCSITIYQRSKLSVTVSLHHPGPVFVGGAKESSTA